MVLPGFGDKWSPPLPLDPVGTPATRRAQSHLVAARARPDGSLVAGLSDIYVADRPEVGAWLFGCASDRPPVGKLTDIGLVYRADFDGQPTSALALHGECLLSQVTVGPYVMGTVLDSHEGHPFIPMGAAVCGIPFEDVCNRRRFAVDLSAACLDYVEAAFMADGRVLVHERRVVMTEAGQFFHEAIRWYNSAGAIGEAPPRSVCLAQLLMRSWERSDVCLGCDPLGVAVRQPCHHKVAAVRGLPMLTFDQWCGSAGSLALAGTSSFELQQYAAAISAATPGDPTRGDVAASETSVVAALPPVGYRYSFHRSDDALSFFSNSMRRSILGGGDQPNADALRLGTPIYQATVALARKAPPLGGGVNEEEEEARQRTRAHRIISEMNKALGELPPAYGASGPPRDGSALLDLVPTEVALWEGSSGPTGPPSVASANSEAVTEIAVAAADAMDGSGGVSSSSGVPAIDETAPATGGTGPAAGHPQGSFIGATYLGSNLSSSGASADSSDQEGSSRAAAVGRADDLALSFPASSLNAANLEGAVIELAPSGSTEAVGPASADGPVAATDVADLAAWTDPSAPAVPSARFFPSAPFSLFEPAGSASASGPVGPAAALCPWVPGGPMGPAVPIAQGELTAMRSWGSVDALYDAIAQRTRPPSGQDARSQPPERAMDASVDSNEAAWPKVEARPSFDSDGRLTDSSSHSGSCSSQEAGHSIDRSSRGGAADAVVNPTALPPTVPTGEASTGEDPPSSSAPSTSSAAASRLVLAAPAAAPSPLSPGRQADDAPRRRAKVHPCPQCDAAFASRSDVTRHVTTVHERRRQWPCNHPGCTFTGLQKGHLTTHVAAVHHASRPYVCAECVAPGRPPFRAISRSAVERHVRRVHRGIRPYGCPTCPQAFASRSDLKRHCQRQHGAAAGAEGGAGGSAGHDGPTAGATGGGEGGGAGGEAAATPSRAGAAAPGGEDGGN